MKASSAWLGLAVGAWVGASSAFAEDPVERLLDSAHAQVGVTTRYDPAYRVLAFPGGDVAGDSGVCTDVVIRAFRAIGIDLQVEVHEDMRAHFRAYPSLWGLSRADRNIDHRRVPNLETFLHRRGASLVPGNDADAYQPGDLVSWRLARGEPHVGIVSDRRSDDGLRPLIVHNIGDGTQVEDVLFKWPPTGHFRYRAAAPASTP